MTNQNIGLSSYDKAKIVLSIEDDEFKINCLTNNDIGLDFFDKSESAISLVDVLLSLKSDEFKLSAIANPNIILSSFEKAKTIVSMEDESLRIACMNDKRFDMHSLEKAMIISSLKDDEKKIAYIQDLNMGFNDKDKLLIICSLHNENKYEKFGLLPNASYRSSLGLPSNMTIGIELEAEGEYAKTIKIIGNILSKWKTANESTLDNGVEIISPILHGTESDMYSVAIICNVMQKLGLYTNERCARTYTFWCRLFR